VPLPCLGVSWFLAIVAISTLIVLHELGHFAVAKAVGLRVERFSLFFGPPIFSVTRGETEYTIGSIPLGGYVRVTGQDPRVEVPSELRARSYYNVPVGRRMLFIVAGPVANLLVAFLIAWIAIIAFGVYNPVSRVDTQGLSQPAAQYLRPGDQVLSVDGRGGSVTAMSKAIASHHCAGTPRAGCLATTPARFVVRRDGKVLTFSIRPRYDAAYGRTRVGLEFAVAHQGIGAGAAASLSVSQLWDVTKQTTHAFTHILTPSGRKQLNGIVGGVYVTQQAISSNAEQALILIAMISLALAIANLLPILPLDGGHLLWALVEKVRGRPVPYAVMERAALVGIFLILALAWVGLSNDINDIGNGSLHLH
jgi:regulator of sigma E protease